MGSTNNSGGNNSRVSIPRHHRKTIEDIKEISGNHSDEDVYAMLQECSMDPNETVQRLLFLDTFHEVKKKRDKRKDNVNGRMFESSRRNPEIQGQGARSGQGRFSSQYTYHDAGGERVVPVRKENVLEDKRERSLLPPALSVLKGLENELFPPISKTSSARVNGPLCMPSDGLSNGHAVQYSKIINNGLPHHVKDAGLMKPETTPSKTKVNAKHAASPDTNLLPIQPRDCQLPAAASVGKSHNDVASMKDSMTNSHDHHVKDAGLMKPETTPSKTKVNAKHAASPDTNLLPIQSRDCQLPAAASVGKSHNDVASMKDSVTNSHEFAVETQTYQDPSGNDDTSELCLSMSEKSKHMNPVLPKINGESLDAVEEVTTEINKLRCAGVQHVILPNHIQVPDSVKNILNFGSLDSRFGVDVNDINTPVSNMNSSQTSVLLEVESAEDSESCVVGTIAAQEEINPNAPLDPQDVSETISPIEHNFSAPQEDKVKQETFPTAGPPYHVLQQAPTYGFNFLPPMLGSPLVQVEGPDHQARLLNSVIGHSSAMSRSAPTPPPIQSPGAVQGPPVAVSVPSLPLMHQQYHPNYIPYAHYIPPFFMPPALQFLGPGVFPPQFPISNMYQPAAAAAATPGMKLSPPYKPGTNVTSQATGGMPSGAFGVYGQPPSAVVTSGSSNANGDLVSAVLKENSAYLGQQQSEGTTLWLPVPGQDSMNLPINPLFCLTPQGQHIAISPQSVPGAFTAMYHPLQTVAPPAAAQPIFQQTESMPGQPEVIGTLLPPNSFHQPPQHQQMNWPGGF